jgi:hypothetical protein
MQGRPSVNRPPAPLPPQATRDADAARRAALLDAGQERERSNAGNGRALRQQGSGGSRGSWEGGARPSADEYQQQVGRGGGGLSAASLLNTS